MHQVFPWPIPTEIDHYHHNSMPHGSRNDALWGTLIPFVPSKETSSHFPQPNDIFQGSSVYASTGYAL